MLIVTNGRVLEFNHKSVGFADNHPVVWAEKFTVDKAPVQVEVIGKLPRRLLPVGDHARFLDGHIAPKHLHTVDDVQIITGHHRGSTSHDLHRSVWRVFKTRETVVLASVIVDAPHVCPVDQGHFPVPDRVLRGPNQIPVQSRVVRRRMRMRGRP